MSGKYILDGHIPVVVEDVLEWATWLEKADQTVVHTQIDDCEVFTVFLGLDYQWGDGPPLLFKTMVVGGEHDGEERHYSTWDEATAGHEAMAALARGEGQDGKAHD